tara:strand:- start:78 stop:893 length:816 start_codon:yes stop_codon:yes gene_type:complete
MKISTRLILGTFIAGIALTSCNKEKDDSTISTENNTLADAAFGHLNDVVDTEVEIIEDNIYGTQKTTAIGDSCANISFTFSNDSSYIDSIIIDYGTLGCEWQGRVRKGKIIITQNGKKSVTGTITKVEVDQFFIDDYQLEGVKLIENLGGTLIPFKFENHVQVIGGKITSPDGTKTFQWNADKNHTLGLNGGIPYLLMEGTVNGINTNGVAFTINTTSPLKAVWGCPRIVEGTLEVTPAGFATRTLDYGNGTCDFKATITVNGNTKNIILW